MRRTTELVTCDQCGTIITVNGVLKVVAEYLAVFTSLDLPEIRVQLDFCQVSCHRTWLEEHRR